MGFKNSVIFVTGGAGFIGSAVIRHLLDETDACIVNIDKLTYASNLDSIPQAAAADRRYCFVQADICDGPSLRRLFESYQPHSVMNLAAESHVDRSIDSPAAFIETNVVGTFTLVQEALHYWRKLGPAARARFRFITSLQMKSTARSTPRVYSLRLHPTRQTLPMRRARPLRIIWYALGTKPMGFPRLLLTAPTTTGRITSPKSLFPI
jgi:GDP-D-mannose dehydratase